MKTHTSESLQERPDRSGITGITFVGDYPRGERVDKRSVEVGDTVGLYRDDVNIQVRIESEDGTGHFTGKIFAFGPTPQTGYQEMAIGDLIRFQERHIFTCASSPVAAPTTGGAPSTPTP